MTAAAYLSNFDGVTVANTTDKKPRSFFGATDTVMNRLVTLPNGTVVNYDGTADPPTMPGLIRQHIVATGASALTNYNAISAKVGMRGTATKTYLAGGSASATGICLAVTPLATCVPTKNFYEYIIEIMLEGDWS